MALPEGRPRHERRGDIEGLRAVAVLLVLLYHARVPSVSGGFAGVDVFFVISGFLITSLLLRELARSGTISITGFYARRARRLLPAATLVLLVMGSAAFLILPPGTHADLGTDVVTATLYVINWGLAWRSVDYLAEDAAPSVFQHYWSLSVEEQFYIVWPLVILLLAFVAARAGLRPTRLTGVVLALLTAASLVFSITHTASSPQTAYFVTTTRAWELGVGALLAFGVARFARMPRIVAEVLAVGGLVLLVLSALVISDRTPWPGSAALLPVVGTAFVIAAGCGTTRTAVGRTLGVAPMRFFGGLSYSLYLWHWPLLVLLDEVRPDQGLRSRLAVVGLSVALAWLTKKYVEDPIRFHQGLARRTRRALTAGATAMAMSVALGFGISTAAPQLVDGIPSWALGGQALIEDGTDPPELTDQPQDAFTRTGEVYPEPSLAPEDVPDLYDEGCQLPVAEEEALACEFGDTSSSTVVAVVGDSKIAQWVPVLEDIGEEQGWLIRTYTKSACTFSGADVELDGEVYAECSTWSEGVLAELTGPDRPAVVITSAGKREALEPDGELSQEALVGGYTDYWGALEQAGVEVAVLADNPHPGGELYTCVEENPADYAPCAFSTREGGGTPALRAAAEAEPKVDFFDFTPWLCPDTRCPAVIGQVMVYRQGSHLTATYVRTLLPVIRSALVPAVERAVAAP